MKSAESVFLNGLMEDDGGGGADFFINLKTKSVHSLAVTITLRELEMRVYFLT